MKKTLLSLALAASILNACSSDDSQPVQQPNANEFTTINVLGQTYTDIPFASSSTVAGSCDEDTYLRVKQFGDFENSKFSISLVFVHKEYYNQFQGYDINDTEVKPEFGGLNCFNNFDFILSYYDNENNDVLTLDNTFDNQHTIQSITVVDEDSEEVTYAVTGSFSLRFKRDDNSLVPITGNYNRFIDVTK